MITIKRNKPAFIRQGWDRYLRLGKTVKKKRKWRAAKGGDSKQRLRERGKPTRPTIGWGANKETFGMVKGMNSVRVENFTQLENVKKGEGIIIASVGKKKRMELIKKANEKGLKILNRYRENQNATK
jgi:large subunit ribosomal protein L32e